MKDRDYPNDRGCATRREWLRLGCVRVLATSLSRPGRPAADALARLNELSQQAVQDPRGGHGPHSRADAMLAEQQAALERHRVGPGRTRCHHARLQSCRFRWTGLPRDLHQRGAPASSPAVLTAKSPQGLIDRMSLQRTRRWHRR
jgi:hypothetical protein